MKNAVVLCFVVLGCAGAAMAQTPYYYTTLNPWGSNVIGCPLGIANINGPRRRSASPSLTTTAITISTSRSVEAPTERRPICSRGFPEAPKAASGVSPRGAGAAMWPTPSTPTATSWAQSWPAAPTAASSSPGVAAWEPSCPTWTRARSGLPPRASAIQGSSSVTRLRPTATVMRSSGPPAEG